MKCYIWYESNLSLRGKILSPVQVFWRFPKVGWIRVNIDGVASSASSFASYGGIFKDSHGKYFQG